MPARERNSTCSATPRERTRRDRDAPVSELLPDGGHHHVDVRLERYRHVEAHRQLGSFTPVTSRTAQGGAKVLVVVDEQDLRASTQLAFGFLHRILRAFTRSSSRWPTSRHADQVSWPRPPSAASDPAFRFSSAATSSQADG
jgi:hypothetical protein